MLVIVRFVRDADVSSSSEIPKTRVDRLSPSSAMPTETGSLLWQVVLSVRRLAESIVVQYRSAGPSRIGHAGSDSIMLPTPSR